MYYRLSSSVVILNKHKLTDDDHVLVWYYSILDVTEGITLDEGAHIAAWVGVFSLPSEKTIRLLRKQYVSIPNQDPLGNFRRAVNRSSYVYWN